MMYAEAKKKSFDRAGRRGLQPQACRDVAAAARRTQGHDDGSRRMKAPACRRRRAHHRQRTWPAAQCLAQAMKHARDVRNRWSFLDLADDAGLLDDFLANDEQ
jgi:hypothetical protein